ncbi:MAG: TolC family protein [Alistipes sp.]|jgi:hypothetical protein|nr:TolC family protein [Alistipes sp.]
MRIIFFLLAVLLALPAAAQNMESVLRQIEQNNTTLRAMGDGAEADRAGLRTGIALPDPEVEVARLWGTPATIGNRTDVAVSQGFDIATVTGMKARQARRRGELLDLGVAAGRIEILLEAKLLCVELIHRNRLARELELRLQHALIISLGYERGLANGTANMLEVGKATLNTRTVEGEIARNDVERNALMAELRRLNGGVEVALDDLDFPVAALPADFEEWFAAAAERSPAMKYARREAEVERRQVTLARTELLPALSVGYMRERTLGQHYQGVTVGGSIPLWAGAGRVKQARAAQAASEARARDARVQMYEQLRGLYARAAGLRQTAYGLADAADVGSAGGSNAALLKRALDVGEISLLEYVLEMGLWYDARVRALEAERDFQLAHSELTAVEL